jgi:3-oxoacyl-[acyl-carrier protein] reductase
LHDAGASRDWDCCRAVVAAARAAGRPDARGYALDLTDSVSIARLLKDVRAGQGDEYIAVLNGGGPKPGTVTAMMLDDWDAAYRLLLRSMLPLIDGLLPAMREKKWGRIVNLSSTSIKAPIPTSRSPTRSEPACSARSRRSRAKSPPTASPST